MKGIRNHKGIIGFILGLFFFWVFFGIMQLLRLIDMDVAIWRFTSSIQRLIFGVLQLWIFVKLFDKKNWKNVINTHGLRKGLLASLGMILFTVYYITTYFTFGFGGFEGLTMPLLCAIILQQITTGFWEGLTFRAFFLEGIMIKIGDRWYGRLVAAFTSATLFGMAHLIGIPSLEQAINRFIVTGSIGLVFAAIYIYSKNILWSMIIHAIYDIPSNLISYVTYSEQHPIKVFLDQEHIFYGSLALIGILAIIFIIIAKPWEEQKTNSGQIAIEA